MGFNATFLKAIYEPTSFESNSDYSKQMICFKLCIKLQFSYSITADLQRQKFIRVD